MKHAKCELLKEQEAVQQINITFGGQHEKGNSMKVGDFVSVHFYGNIGCRIGKLISDEGETVTVSIGKAIVTEIPKDEVDLWVSV